jgi:hypothetical protein
MDDLLSNSSVGAEAQEGGKDLHFGLAEPSGCLIGEPPGGSSTNSETRVSDWKMQIYRLKFRF